MIIGNNASTLFKSDLSVLGGFMISIVSVLKRLISGHSNVSSGIILSLNFYCNFKLYCILKFYYNFKLDCTLSFSHIPITDALKYDN